MSDFPSLTIDTFQENVLVDSAKKAAMIFSFQFSLRNPLTKNPFSSSIDLLKGDFDQQLSPINNLCFSSAAFCTGSRTSNRTLANTKDANGQTVIAMR